MSPTGFGTGVSKVKRFAIIYKRLVLATVHACAEVEAESIDDAREAIIAEEFDNDDVDDIQIEEIIELDPVEEVEDYLDWEQGWREEDHELRIVNLGETDEDEATITKIPIADLQAALPFDEDCQPQDLPDDPDEEDGPVFIN